MPRRSKMMKTMKSMSEEAAAVRRFVLFSDEDDVLNVQQEWDLTFHEMPESDDDDDDDDDDDNNDVEPLREDFANIEKAIKLLEAQTAIEEYRLWKDDGATSNLRDRGNSRATYYKNKRKVEVLKSSAKGSLDIRSFFQVQDEDEDSDDTIDEMEMNSFIPRMEMLPEVPNRYSQEDALEKLLPLVKITRNKR